MEHGIEKENKCVAKIEFCTEKSRNNFTTNG